VQPKLHPFGAERTTHFISGDALNDSVRAALDLNVDAVTANWVSECARLRKLCAVAPFVCGQVRAARGDVAVRAPGASADAAAPSVGSRGAAAAPNASTTAPVRRQRTPDFAADFADLEQRDERLLRKSAAAAQHQVFAGWTVHVSGYAPRVCEVLATTLVKGGATLSAGMIGHAEVQRSAGKAIIVADTLTADVFAALQAQAVPVVSRCWVDESAAAHRALAIDAFAFRRGGSGGLPLMAPCGGGGAVRAPSSGSTGSTSTLEWE
jgi:hypothetical protein